NLLTAKEAKRIWDEFHGSQTVCAKAGIYFMAGRAAGGINKISHFPQKTADFIANFHKMILQEFPFIRQTFQIA
ncbi:MAG: hypothetical protein ABFC97_04645, partial [Anaerolineaceae bacterium]